MKRKIRLTESDIIRIVEKVINEQDDAQERGGTSDAGGAVETKMTDQEFDAMLNKNKRFKNQRNKTKAIVDALLKWGEQLDKNFNAIGQILTGLQKGKNVGASFIKNTLMAMGLARMMSKK